MRFRVPLARGQKTGWFYDQAANRAALLKYVRGAARARRVQLPRRLGPVGGARRRVRSALRGFVRAGARAAAGVGAATTGSTVQARRGDAFDVLAALREAGERFDVVVIDPPAFIKRRKDMPKGQAAYRKLNQLAMQLLPRDGLLVSCSCSYHLAQDDLIGAIQQAARHLGRFAQILEVGGQAPDHPIHPGHPGDALPEGAFCRVTASSRLGQLSG